MNMHMDHKDDMLDQYFSALREKSESDAPYSSADEAYRDIHEVLAHAVSLAIDCGEYTEAMKYAALMLEIEGLMNGR